MADQPPEVKFTTFSEISPPSPATLGSMLRATGHLNQTEEVNPGPGHDSFSDPDDFIVTAKHMVTENYNNHPHHRSSDIPVLEIDEIFVISSEKVLDNWRVIISSRVVKGLLWMVTLNKHRSEAYIEVFKKINNIRVPAERDE